MTLGIGLAELETFPVGVALPLWDCIVRCQETPPSSWPPAAYDLIGKLKSHGSHMMIASLHNFTQTGRADVAKSLNFSSPSFSPKIEVSIL